MIPFEGYRTFSINYVNHVQQIMYVWLNRSRDTSPNFHILHEICTDTMYLNVN